MGRLDGKNAIVTGGATGLGRSTALLYAREGANVLVADLRDDEGRHTVAEIRAAGGTAVFAHVDVRSAADVAAAVQTAEERFGALHIMTANAGVLGRSPWTPLEELSEEHWAEVIDINLNGVYRCFKYAVPALRRAGGGAMSATASLSATAGFPRLESYAASKAGVVSLVRSLAADLAPSIRVNAVSPGSMRTELGRHTAEDQGLEAPELQGPPTADVDAVPRADPSQVAEVHLFLVSDAASFVTGQTLVADGGWSLSPL